MKGKPVVVIGAGSWGTALALVLAERGHTVRMRDPDPSVAARLQKERENLSFLPGFLFPDTLEVMYEIDAAVDGAGAAVLAVPSRVFREVAGTIPPEAVRSLDWVIATKGLEESTGLRMSEVFADVTGADAAVLAGPSLAREVAEGQPTSVLAASLSAARAERARDLFHGATFRVYTSDDLIGVEVGTGLKNIVALAAGILAGMGFGANAYGALLTRGMAEITRLGVAMGARPETFLGLAGIGDLVTTCTSPLSRNRTLGEAIGRGVPAAEAIAAMTQVTEGVPTVRSALLLSRRFEVEMPIAEEVSRVLFEGAHPRESLARLMARPPRKEEIG